MMNDTEPAAGESHPHGLTSQDAGRRLKEYGPNAVAEEKPRMIIELLRKFWAPVPWMLEVTVILELILDKKLEAAIIGALLVFNALLSLFQEGRARNALALLRQRLSVHARVMRDGTWSVVAAEELVPGDYIHLRMGDVVPADVAVSEGNILADQSALTGESLPVEIGPGQKAYAGALIKRGEASGEVGATGARTYFGRTAELVRSAKTVSHLAEVIFTIVKYLVAMDGALVAALLVFTAVSRLPFAEMLPYALILLVASVPVALPATFTLATGLGALELAKRGVLVTRLSAIEEAAAMDVLCSDKTGTITQNQLSVAALNAYAPADELEVLRLGAYASDEKTQDPIDIAILSRAKEENLLSGAARQIRFVPFDPATKLTEATVERDGRTIHVLKGAPQAIADRVGGAFEIAADVERLASYGYRVLAVAADAHGALRMMGLIALEDPPRPDSRPLVQSLGELGVRVKMITGDGLATAQAVAKEVGITGDACSAHELREGIAAMLGCDVFAGVYPEDKYHLVRALQQRGHVVGMTGDGVNDAPALKQAEVGIAVANATDVAKASASLVLTDPGLTDALSAVESSRQIYQRMLTYTLNKIIKTVQIALFLALGVMLTNTFIITPRLIVLLLFANDFLTMSISTDNVSFSRKPDRWRIKTLMIAGLAVGSLVLIISFALFYLGKQLFGLDVGQLQTLDFVTLVFTGQATVYLVRERHHFWNSAPSLWMIISSVVDVCVVSLLAIDGILMVPIGAEIVGIVLIVSVAYVVVLDFLKVVALRRLNYSGS